MATCERLRRTSWTERSQPLREEIAIDFVDYVRPMMKMESVEQLQAQMDEDLRRTAEIRCASLLPSKLAGRDSALTNMARCGR